MWARSIAASSSRPRACCRAVDGLDIQTQHSAPPCLCAPHAPNCKEELPPQVLLFEIPRAEEGVPARPPVFRVDLAALEPAEID
jgi:hypothetical protein